jgi:hypothetical protein
VQKWKNSPPRCQDLASFNSITALFHHHLRQVVVAQTQEMGYIHNPSFVTRRGPGNLLQSPNSLSGLHQDLARRRQAALDANPRHRVDPGVRKQWAGLFVH